MDVWCYDNDSYTGYTVARLDPADGVVLAKWTVPRHYGSSMCVVPDDGRVILIGRNENHNVNHLIVYDSEGHLLSYYPVDVTEQHRLARGLPWSAAQGRFRSTDDTDYVTVERVSNVL